MRLNPTKQSHIPPNIHKVMNHPQNINYRTPNFRFAGHTRLNYRQEGSLCLLDWLAPMTPQLQFANTPLTITSDGEAYLSPSLYDWIRKTHHISHSYHFRRLKDSQQVYQTQIVNLNQPPTDSKTSNHNSPKA